MTRTVRPGPEATVQLPSQLGSALGELKRSHWQFKRLGRDPLAVRNGSSESGGPARIGEPPDLSRRHDVVIMIFVPTRDPWL